MSLPVLTLAVSALALAIGSALAQQSGTETAEQADSGASGAATPGLAQRRADFDQNEDTRITEEKFATGEFRRFDCDNDEALNEQQFSRYRDNVTTDVGAKPAHGRVKAVAAKRGGGEGRDVVALKIPSYRRSQ